MATECADVGGHSRMAWRWIERDADSVPTLALTRHRGPVPDRLTYAVGSRGGRLEIIEGHDQLARARALGRLVDAADLVVLHVHPFDAVAPIALADRGGRPPVVLVNHADHCFWLGPRVADLVVSTRPAAARSCAARRGVTPERTSLLAVPADAPVALPDRERARRALGLPADARVLVAMASAYKLERIDDVGFLDLLEPVVAALPGTILVAVGPEDEGAWRAAGERTGGRVRALGVLPDPSAALAAGDVFVDGYPCSSLTAALEAAAAGLPVVSHQPPRPQAATYDIDEPALGAAPRARGRRGRVSPRPSAACCPTRTPAGRPRPPPSPPRRPCATAAPGCARWRPSTPAPPRCRPRGPRRPSPSARRRPTPSTRTPSCSRCTRPRG